MIPSTHSANAPSKSTRLTILEANDADLHAHNLSDWQQQYDQIGAGSFYGSISELQFRDLQVFKEHTSQALRQSCNVWSDSIWIGLPACAEQDVRINGIKIEEDQVMCRPGDIDFELVTPEEFDIFGMVISHAKLINAAERQNIEINWHDLIHQGRLCIPHDTIQAMRLVLQRLLAPARFNMPAKLAQDMVMMSILEVLQKELPAPLQGSSYQRRKAVVDNAKGFLDSHPDSPVTIADLCEICHVSRRTLQYSFDSILGISPLQYLRISRLNGVRRALHQANPGTQIAEVAAQWGFWHLSQFAQDYKQLFGELPSQTLHKFNHKDFSI